MNELSFSFHPPKYLPFELFLSADIRGEAERVPGGAGCQSNPPGDFRGSDPGAENKPGIAGARARQTGPEAPTADANTDGAAEAAG